MKKYKITFKDIKLGSDEDGWVENPSYVINPILKPKIGALNLITVFGQEALINADIPYGLHFSNPRHYSLKEV